MSKLPVTQEERHRIIVDALQALETGSSLRDIAKSINMAYATLRVWLLDDIPNEYKPAQRRALLTRIAESDEELETASDHVAIARARERCKFTRWDAERRLPTMFSPRQEITGPGGGPIQLDNLERARRIAYINSTVIDAEIVSTQCSTTST